jgi:hypothetical protein
MFKTFRNKVSIAVAAIAALPVALYAQAPTVPTVDTTIVENYIKTNVANAVIAVGTAVIIVTLVVMLIKWIRKMAK